MLFPKVPFLHIRKACLRAALHGLQHFPEAGVVDEVYVDSQRFLLLMRTFILPSVPLKGQVASMMV